MESMVHEERLARWFGIAKDRPPEWLTTFMDSSKAHWVVITEEGGEADHRRSSAFLEQVEDLPYWAFVLAKSYLDDVGEWPLFGMKAEMALNEFLDHHDPILAVREILSSIETVWPDFSITFIGKEEAT
ncbi:MAG: hypothetical protein H7832_00625 [Magnetococcus sp. DMHC-6]